MAIIADIKNKSSGANAEEKIFVGVKIIYVMFVNSTKNV
jgi:hypothetical protein